jgi:radical SAM superfamily enzyme YgiQ (UPF0313 family)
MKIGLVNLKSTFLENPMMYQQLGLAYLSSHLQAQGHSVGYVDLNEDPLPKDGEYDQLWVTATSSQMFAVQELSNAIADYKTPVVLGGVATSTQKSRFEKMNYTLYVKGEADVPNTITEILELADSGKKGQFYQAPKPKNLEHGLPPDRQWAHRYKSFMDDPNGGDPLPLTTMFTTRGCPFTCSFCDSSRGFGIWGDAVRYESDDVVRQQLDTIVAQNYKAVQFYDDIMPLNRKRTEKIAEMLAERNIVWRVFLRSDIMNNHGGKDYLKFLAERGLREACVGVESGSNYIKDNIGKKTTIEQDTKVLQWCNEVGVVFKASTILGLPGENYETMNATRDWILTNKPGVVQVLTLIPFPGTPIDKDMEAAKLNPELRKQPKYDVWTVRDFPEEAWYTGKGLQNEVVVRTSALTSEQIEKFQLELKKEIITHGINIRREKNIPNVPVVRMTPGNPNEEQDRLLLGVDHGAPSQ